MDKIAKLAAFRLRPYRIYGIYDFITDKLIHVGLDLDSVLFEYDIEDYDEERYDIVSFDVLLA